ncbi:hypothetical protein ACMBCN_03435, partial [Candidatus Liberibacter asiaticus]|nr:hypothetical protein [Candidatus Liberibacter asiaticus]
FFFFFFYIRLHSPTTITEHVVSLKTTSSMMKNDGWRFRVVILNQTLFTVLLKRSFYSIPFFFAENQERNAEE